jgi:hypothetical protein
MASRLPVAALASCLLVSSVAAGAAAEARVSYTISYVGFQIARANLAVKVEDGLYTAGLGYKTTGMVKVVSDAKGEAVASGAVAGGKVVGASYTLKSDEGADSKDVLVEMTGGVVGKTSAVPPLKAVEKRVPFRPEHLKGTIDPLGGALFPIVAASPLAPENCARTAPVFDGWTRYDIVFSFKKTTPLKLKGYTGDGLVCAARWVPVAGHRPDTPGTKFMGENKGLDVTLVPTATGLLVPVGITVPTLSGTIAITADRVSVGD